MTGLSLQALGIVLDPAWRQGWPFTIRRLPLAAHLASVNLLGEETLIPRMGRCWQGRQDRLEKPGNCMAVVGKRRPSSASLSSEFEESA